jgi:hypothetical protein
MELKSKVATEFFKWCALVLIAWCVYGGVSYGWNQRLLRKRAVDRLGPSRLQYERMLDPDRTSSGLTTTGETSPEEL